MYDIACRLAIVLELLLFYVLLSSTAIANAATADDHTLRLAVIDYVVDYLKVPSDYDYIQFLPVSLNFLLAAKHVNDRRSDILPVLALPGCPVNVSIVAYVDDGGFAARGMYAMEQYNSQIDAVVGESWSVVASTAGFLSTAIALPVVSGWASSPSLNNRVHYPYFARTIPDDGVIAGNIVTLLHQWGYRRFALLYEETLSSAKDAFNARSTRLGMNLTAFAIKENSSTLLRGAVHAVASFNLNILVLHTSFRLLRTQLAEALLANGYFENDKLIVFTDFGPAPSPEDFATYPLLKPLFRGAIRVESGNRDPALFDAYLKRWDTEFASPSYISYLNSFLPPNGDESNMDLGALDVSNWGYSMNVTGPDFFAKTKSAAYIVWGMIYDTVVALALAKCRMIRFGKEPSRIELRKQMLETEFDGLSGSVRFTPDGRRNTTSMIFLVRNWDANLNVETVGAYNSQLSEFVFTKPLHFRLGRMPPQITPPPEVKQHLPLGWMIVGYVEIGILNVFGFACLFWTYWYRKDKVVLHAQRSFLYMIAIGCIIAAWSMLASTIDDEGNSLDPNICMLGPWLFIVGIMLATTALLARIVRILRVFDAPIGSAARSLVRHPVAISGMAVVLTIEIALLIAWTVVNPMVWKRNVTVVDENGFAFLSYGACTPQDESNFGTGYGFLITLLAIHICILFVLGILNHKVKRYPEEFQENRYIAILLAVLIQLYIIAVPVFIVVIINPIGRFLVITTFAFCSCFFVLFFIFVPKMYQVRKNQQFRKWQALQVKEMEDTSAGLSNNAFSGEVDFEEGIRNAYVRDKFRNFAECNFVVESFYFYMDAEEFREHPLTSDGKLDIENAKDIYDIYIREGSLMEINISSRTRAQVTAAYNEFVGGRACVSRSDHTSIAIDKTQAMQTEFASIFVPAQKEIVDLLNNGAWRTFVEEGGMYRPPNYRSSQQSQQSSSSPVPLRRVLTKAGAERAAVSPPQGVGSLSRSDLASGSTSAGLMTQIPTLRNRGTDMDRSSQQQRTGAPASGSFHMDLSAV